MPASPMSKVLQHLRGIADAENEDLSDAQLLNRFLAVHDERAFETLVRRHGPMVLGVCWRILNNVHDAEDAFQATFLVLVRKAKSIRQRETVGGFLYGVAYKTALKARAVNEHRRKKEREAAEMPRRQPLEQDIGHELHALLDEELSHLPDKYRVPIVLCDLEGKTRKTAAKQLGWREGTLSGRLARARTLLAKRLSRRGVTLSGGAAALGLSADAASACVPHSLVASTVKAAGCLAAEQAAIAGAIAPKVIALMEGVLKSMLATKLKIAAVVLLLTGMLGGTGLLIPLAFSELPAEAPSEPKAEAKAPLRSQEKKQAARTDRYGDPLPPGAIARLGTIRWRLPRFGADRVVVSDSKSLVSVNPLAGISIWDRETGKIIRQFPSASEPGPEWLSKNRQWGSEQSGAAQRSTALSADGRTAVFATIEGVLYVVDTATGKVRQRCRGHGGIIQETAISADGKVLASCSEDDTLRIWDAVSGKEIHRLNAAKQKWGQRQPAHLALAPNGKMAAWVGTEEERPIHVYDLATGEEKHHLLAHPGGERGIAFSPRGDLLLASCGKGPDQLWDVRTGRMIRALSHKSVHYPAESAFSADGSRLALVFFGRGLQLHDVDTGKEIWRSDSWGGSMEPEALAFAPDGQILYAKLGKLPGWVLSRYDARTGKHFAAAEESREDFRTTVFAPDDRSLYSLGWDKQLHKWDVATGAAVQETMIPYLDGGVFSPDGRFFLDFPDQDRILRILSLDSRKEMWRQRSPANRRVSAVAFSSDGKILAVSEAGDTPQSSHRIVIRGTANGEEQGRLGGLKQGVIDLLLSPDGRSLVWLTEDKPNSGTRKIIFQDRSSGRKLREPIGWVAMRLDPIAFSPDGKTLALHSKEDKNINFLECANWKKRLDLPPVALYPCPLVFSPDGSLFLVGDHDGGVRVFDAHTGRLLRRLAGHRALVNSLVVSHDGRKLASASWDTTALIWDITDLYRDLDREQVELSPAELRSLWENLASADAAKAYQAIGRLARSDKQALSWLRKHLPPVAEVDARQLAQLLADLDDDRFPVRDKATRRLAELGELAVPALRKILTGLPTPELRRRAESLLEQAEALSPDRLRIMRSVEVAESIGSTNAETLLKEWAKGAAAATLTREAKSSLQRLAKRRIS